MPSSAASAWRQPDESSTSRADEGTADSSGGGGGGGDSCDAGSITDDAGAIAGSREEEPWRVSRGYKLQAPEPVALVKGDVLSQGA